MEILFLPLKTFKVKCMKKNCLRKIAIGFATIIFATPAVLAQTTYTSESSGDFNNPATWGVASLSASDYQNKNNIFIVDNNCVVYVNDSVNVYDLQVTKGTLKFGASDEVSRTVIVNNKFSVSATGSAVVSEHMGVHTLRVKKGITSTGIINFREGTGQAVNVVLDAGAGNTQSVDVKTGETETNFSNFEVLSGTVKAETDLRIGGALSINSTSTFNANAKTIYIAGNFTNSGTFTYKNSKVVFKSKTVQSISGTAKFNDVEVSGGGFLVISNDFSVYGDFEVKEKSTVSSSANLYFFKNFAIRSESKYDVNTGVTDFAGDGTNGTKDQTVTIEGEATFNAVRFYCNKTGGVKTFNGNINATSYVRVYAGTRLVDAVGDYQHTFVGAIVDGDMALQNPMIIKGGTLRRDDKRGPFSIGTGEITIHSGTTSVRSGDTLNVSSNVTVLTGASFVLSGDEAMQSEIIGTLGKSFTVENGAVLYIRGANDNFPKGFGSVVLGETSSTYYDSKFNQKVHGGVGVTYGHLVLDYYDKTFNGPTTIAGHLHMRPMTNGESTVYFGEHSHTLCYHFYDEPDRKGTTSLVSEGTITLKSTGNHGQTIYKRTTGKYEFKNLNIENDDPTYAQTKTIGGDIWVYGKLTMSNSSDNEILLLSLDLDNHYIFSRNEAGNDLVMGGNTCIKTSGKDNFKALTETFRNVELQANSIIQFDATDTEQYLPSIEYDNVYLYGSTAKIAVGDITLNGWINQNGGTPKLTITGNKKVTIRGDWKLGTSYLDIEKDVTISFEGDNQNIVGTTLPNVEIRGSGIKKLQSTLTVEGDLKVYSGCEFDADNRTINLYGDFSNFDGGGGVFHQNDGRLNLRGAVGEEQSVVCAVPENTRFFNVYIERTKTDTVYFDSDIYVGGNLMTAENKGSLHIDNHTLTIGGDFYLYRNCKFAYTTGANLIFNSSTAEQRFSNQNTENKYPKMRFIGGAVKRLTDNPFDIDGDVTIDNGAIVTSGVKLYVSGNWENSGTFNSSSEVEFDGADQLISGSAFNNVTFGGTGSKRLNGIINLTGWLKIDSHSTLDVSPNDGGTYYDITVAGDWYNNIVAPDGESGKFIPRKGTVTFLGNSSNIYSGDSLNVNGVGRPYKGFYNVVINTSDPNNYIRLYPIHGSKADEMTYENDLYVANDFTINTGIFYFYWNMMFVGGNVRNLGGNLSMNSHYDARNKLFLGGATGKNYVFDPGITNTIRQIEINNGATYKLASSYLQYSSSNNIPKDSIIRIKNGTLWMKDCDIKFEADGGIRIDEGGTLHLDSAAVIEMAANRAIRNFGTLELKGHPNSPAKIQSASTDGNYYIVQESGTFSAEEFCIEGTRGRGLEIRGGTVKKLKNGSFSNSGTVWNYNNKGVKDNKDKTFYGVSGTETTFLLTLNGITLGDGGAGLTADNITFNSKNSLPEKNVHRTTGLGAITFTNYGGTLAGAANEVDSEDDLIKWSLPNGCVWTGGGNNNRWHNPDNWASRKVPTKDSVVVLNHSWPGLASNYTILVDERAEVKDLTIDSGVTLELNGITDDSKNDGLEVFGKLSMMDGSTLTQTDFRNDSLILHGTWTCSGTYNHNHAPVVFDMSTGTYQFILNSSTDVGAMIVRSSMDGALSLLGEIYVVDSVRYESGTIYGNNAKIHLAGDWIPAGGTFDEGESVVNFNKTSGTQTIRGGRFWEIGFMGAGEKIISQDIAVNSKFRIDGSAEHISAEKNIYMSGRTTYWYNYRGEVFDQNGGSVIFNGGAAYIGELSGTTVKTKPTKFNNLIIQGSSTKYIRDITKVSGSFEMSANVDISISRYGSLLGLGSSSSLTQYGGAMVIYGENNFPDGFGTIDLTGGSVYYRDSCDNQVVRGVEYNTLYLYNYYFTTYGYKDYTTKTLENNITVKGTMYIYDSITTLDVQGKTITLMGGLSLADDGKQIKWGTDGTVIHTGGTWSVDIDIDTLNHVYKKGTGYLTMNNDLVVTGDIEFDPETQLRMGSYKMTGKGGNFKMGVNCQLHSSVVKGADNNVAFPTDFGSYELDETSVTYLEAAADQILQSGVEYGTVYLNNTASRTVELNGDITVRGNFYNNQDGTVLDDKGIYNLHLLGATIDLRNYRPTTTTVFLEGNGDQKIYAGGGYTELYLNNLELAGSGVKEIDETLTKIGGNITIGTGTSFSSDNAIEFGGDAITNNGTFRHYGSTFTFTGKKSHTISMGADNIFNSFSLVDDDTVNIVDNGITVNTGVFGLGKRAKLDMGGYTHKIASAQIDLGADCNWVTANANLIFNRGGNQKIPALECRNIQFSTSSTKTLEGKLRADTLTIDEGVTFSVGSEAKKSNSVTIFGDWICNGSFTSHNDTVFFESATPCKDRKIKTNEQWFSDVVFHRNTEMGETDTTIFKLIGNMSLKNNMEIDTGAVVSLNKNTLVIGNDDTNLTEEPIYPDGEKITVNKGGELRIGPGGTLQFNHLDGNTHLDVYGKLSMVGESKANAVITRSSTKYDTRGTEIIIHKYGKLAAQYYQVQYLAPAGFIIENKAIIDDVNNLSNGIWSNMYTSNDYKNPFQYDDNVKIDTFTYLTINVDRMVNPINNIAFNHGGTPSVGHHFNIARDTTLLDTIELTGTINGALGFIEYQKYHYRDNDPSKAVVKRNIKWPGISQIIWTGLVSQDWFDARNWFPMQLPDDGVSVKIPMTSNAPIIYKRGAQCKSLTISKGSLTIENFTRPADEPALYVNGSVDVQDGGVFAISGNADVLVNGDWSIATKGNFVPQNGTVIFAADGGSVSIVPRKSDFNNVKFVGDATYMFMYSPINFNGDFIAEKGLVWPATSDYTYNIGGNYRIDAAGGFNSDVVGFVNFSGTNQTIENGKFNRVKFSNTGNKELSGTFDAVYNSSTRTARTVIVEGSAVMKATAGCELTIKGNVLINSAAGFNDGGETHTFTGYYWEGSDNYVGNGKIKFNANHAQYICGGSFHDIDMTLSTKNIYGDVTLTGDLNMESCTLDMLINHIEGAGTFTMGNKSNVYARGDDNYPKFANYSVTGGATCYSYYNGPMDQIIRSATYGHLYLNSNTIKTLEGDITVQKNLYFYENGGTLRANGKVIYVGQHWYNQSNGVFEPGTSGRVIFNGSTGNQYAYLGASVENPFYNIEIDKPADQQFYASSVNLTVDGSLYVTSGKMHCVAGYRVWVGGDLVVGGSGLITQSGHYELRHKSSSCSIQTNGSILNDLTLNGDATFVLSDDLTVYGNFTLQKGTFDQNHHVATLGNSLDNVVIYGTYKVSYGGKLRMGDGTSLVVKNGGKFEAVGEEANYALITNAGGTGRYYFTVEDGAQIKANYYNFSYLAKQGIIISADAFIDERYNFSNGVFSNVVSGGVCLDIRNTQTFKGTDSPGRITNISFPHNPGGGAVNIRKVETSDGDIEVYNATGLLAGELYENDPHGIIEWTGDVEYTWTGANTRNPNDWWDRGNWVAKLNGAVVAGSYPTADNNVIIPSTVGGSGKYPIIDRDSAFAKRITIKNGAELTIKIETDDADSIRCALYATSDVTIEGTLTMTSGIDSLSLRGNWIVASSGKFNAGDGTVVMAGVGVKTIQNRVQSFNNLVIDNNGTMQAQSAMKVGGNFTINQGVFDVASYDVTVGGSFVNNATFLPQSRTLNLTGIAPYAEGESSYKFNPGGSTYYNVAVKNGIYDLEENELFVNRNLDIDGGTLNVNANVLNIGDGTGVDNVNITGTLNMQRDSKLKMGNNAIINVNPTGTISMIGNVNHEAIVTSQKMNGTYAFNVYGTIAASYYKVERINAAGLHLFAGSTIDGTYTMSHGQFVSGTAGGRYIWFENNFGTAADDSVLVINNVYFNAGPANNAKRSIDGTDGIISFLDAVGVVASHFFEDDDEQPMSGAILWQYSGDVLQWVGNNDNPSIEHSKTRWDNPANWYNMSTGEGGYPTDETQLQIFQVNHGQYPIIYSDLNDENWVAEAKGITLFEGSSLTLQEGHKLKVEGGDAGLIIGPNSTFTAYDSVFIKGQFSNAGKFDNGKKSTIVWASSLSCNIEMNGWPFYNFVVENGKDATVTLSVEPGKSLIIENDFTIKSGTVDCNSGTLEVGGNFINKNGEFVHGGGTVKMKGAETQRLLSQNGLLTFNHIELTGNGKKEIESDIEVIGNITVGATVQAVGITCITCRGNWYRPASSSYENNFIGGDGWVKFKGTSIQTIGKPEKFTNLEIDNSSSSAAISTTHSQTITGELKLTKGIFNAENPVCLESEAIITGVFGDKNYVNGSIKKVDATSGFLFPIGSNDRYAPIKISDFDGTGTYLADYSSESPDNRNNLGEYVNQVSSKEFWTLTRTAGTDMPRVTLYWNSRKLSGLEDMDVLSVVLYTGNKWTRQGAMIKDDDLTAFDGDTVRGCLISRDKLTALGKITFGFCYPTIEWDKDATDNTYVTKSNWVGGKHAPKSSVNIYVNEYNGENYPTVKTEGHCYDMTITESGKLKVADGQKLTVHGDAKIDGELLLGEGSEIVFMKDVLASDARVTAGNGSTVVLCSNNNRQQVGLNSCHNLKLLQGEDENSGKYIKTLTDDITVEGSISIEKNTQLTGDRKKINLMGDFTINSAGDLMGTTNLVMCGTGKQKLSITPNKPLYDLTINNTYKAEGESCVDLGTGIVVKGQLTLTEGILRSKSTARLSLESSAHSTKGNANSYVIGEMEKKGKSDFVFPIGSEEHGLAQIGVSGLTSDAHLIAEYVTAKPALVANLDEANLKKVSHLESWHLGNGSSSSTHALLTLYWNDSTYSQIYKPEDLLVAYVDNGVWKSLGMGSVEYEVEAGNVTSATKVEIGGSYRTPRAAMRQSARRTLNSSTPQALGDGGGVLTTFGTMNPVMNPLPIELYSFDATVTPNADVRLNWSTASEHNNAYFTIEHMFDGESDIVDTVKAKGGAGVGADYSYLHINQPAGTHYYRLHQTDYDGETTVASDWVAVVIENAEQLVLTASVAPNPGRCQDMKFMIGGISGGKLRYVVADMSGQSLIDRTVATAGSSSYQIDAIDWNLQPAMYLIKVFTDNGQMVVKFVVE